MATSNNECNVWGIHTQDDKLFLNGNKIALVGLLLETFQKSRHLARLSNLTTLQPTLPLEKGFHSDQFWYAVSFHSRNANR